MRASSCACPKYPGSSPRTPATDGRLASSGPVREGGNPSQERKEGLEKEVTPVELKDAVLGFKPTESEPCMIFKK